MSRQGRFWISVAGASSVLMAATGTFAGDLEPPGPPAPTMKTLDEIPGSWHRHLDATDGDANGCGSSRFRCVLDEEAVLDLETGLTWQRRLDNGERTWADARLNCQIEKIGNRFGWRLPSISELLSLFVPLQDFGAQLPPGHPFDTSLVGPQQRFWSGNVELLRLMKTGQAWAYDFDLPSSRVGSSDTEEQMFNSICIRGPESTPSQ